jgi:hypothetical protein
MTRYCQYIAVILLSTYALACGSERWQVKVLKDHSVAEINFTPKPETLHALRELPAPEGLRAMNGGIRLPQEKQVYIVDALLIGFKREADGDLHLVLADPVDRAKTMIAEIPSTACAAREYAQQFKQAAGAVTAIHSAGPAYRRLPKPVRVSVTGVLFFDFIHGQTGVAPNGVELHPVLSLNPVR